MFLQGVDKTVFGVGRGDAEGMGMDDRGLTETLRKMVSGKFVIFSGGKLERRKGQDIVLAAFKHFAKMHDDVFLLTNWQNDWVETVKGIDEGGVGVVGVPEYDAGRGGLMINEWMRDNGVEGGSALDVGRQTQGMLGRLVREFVDVGVFVSRCEGGTNLVLMETIGGGKLCIVGEGTGMVDVVEKICENGGCIVVGMGQGKGKGKEEGWREAKVADVVAEMEKVYVMGKEELGKIGRKGGELMWEWEVELHKMLEQI